MLIRAMCLGHETLDYQNFLAKWVEFYRQNGGWSALSQSVGNYNVPYLYFLALFSYLPVSDLYLIKLLSIFFDVVLAWGIMRLVYVFRQTPAAVLTGFFLTLFLPTVVLNGAYWGQCDCIYTAFAVWAVYFALDRRPILSVVFAALSFAFKLQAVFLLPAYLMFVYTGRVKWRHLLAFPVTYILVVLPAILAGRPPLDTVLLYFNQAGTAGSALNYNSSSVFALVGKVENTSLASLLGIAAAAVFLALVLLWLYLCRDRVSDRAVLGCVLLICVGVPFLLPHMHERYFFMADVLSLALAVVTPGFCFVPVLVSFASFLGYYAYLNMRFLLPMRYGAAALVASLAALALYVFCQLRLRESPRGED
jgi:Gpi18-like mannosyltransferase